MQQTVDIPGVATSPRTVNVFVITRVLSRDARGIMNVSFGFLVYIIRLSDKFFLSQLMKDAG